MSWQSLLCQQNHEANIEYLLDCHLSKKKCDLPATEKITGKGVCCCTRAHFLLFCAMPIPLCEVQCKLQECGKMYQISLSAQRNVAAELNPHANWFVVLFHQCQICCGLMANSSLSSGTIVRLPSSLQTFSCT